MSNDFSMTNSNWGQAKKMRYEDIYCPSKELKSQTVRIKLNKKFNMG